MGKRNIFLYGAPGSGKTTLGESLAEALNRTAIDTDALVAELEGRSIPEIFAAAGEAGFRAAERRALREALKRTPDGGVVSLGGGTLLDEENRRLCEESGLVVCLEAPSREELARRLQSAPGSRPLGDRSESRAGHYASFPCRLAAFFTLQDSLVLVGSGIAAMDGFAERVVADSEVARCWSGRFGEPVAIIPSGEVNKTPQTVCGLWSSFARCGTGRKNRVTAFGGGVTGDLTGFAAATWMRGIDWINVPTTLLSMVDASTGGKTGCDLPEGKNLAGAFHPPRLVVADTDFLKTLPERELRSGRAEMIKHEIIADLPRVERPYGIPSASEIARSLGVKVEIVRSDPFERTGRRMLLNCGHTVGHAIEKAAGYGAISHGEAVAIGCVEEARLAVGLGLAEKGWPEELAARFADAGLPVELPAGMSFDLLVPDMRGDKKRDGDKVVFALPCGWGDVRKVEVDLR